MVTRGDWLCRVSAQHEGVLQGLAPRRRSRPWEPHVRRLRPKQADHAGVWHTTHTEEMCESEAG